MTKNICFTVIWVMLCIAGTGLAHADAADKKLRDFFNQIKSMKADFSQSIVSESKPSVEKSSGVLQMERPGKFRWDYSFPFKQQIVADGRKLWIYDIEMDQVIVKPLDLVLGNTPAVLLSGNADIAEKFEVSEITTTSDSEKGLFWMQLSPKQEETGFEKLLLAFSGNDLRVMELKDAFGQVTRIKFSNLKQNPDIDPSVFRFVVPPGVDVIDDTSSNSQ